jgi:prophage DNA circulation protein
MLKRFIVTVALLTLPTAVLSPKFTEDGENESVRGAGEQLEDRAADAINLRAADLSGAIEVAVDPLDQTGPRKLAVGAFSLAAERVKDAKRAGGCELEDRAAARPTVGTPIRAA